MPTIEERIAKVEKEIAVLKENVKNSAAGSYTQMLKAELSNRAQMLRKLKDQL